MKTTRTLTFAAVLMLLGAPAAQGIELMPDAAFAAVGAGPDGLTTASAGVVWDWNWEALRSKAEVTGHTELSVSGWRARDFSGGHQGFRQLVLLPVLRLQVDRGRSPWYLEFGIGASWMDRLYITPDKNMSKQFNFYDVLGAGYRFGAGRKHELGLRYVHVSNGGLKDPNPGEDFLQLRYAARF